MSTGLRPATPRSWPPSPYKGLSYYDPEDALLFAGRENDVRECARLLELPNSRIVILHGLTACGKSSFLRAGLIPRIETSDGGFHFVHHEEDGKRRAWFARCTDRPMETLAETVSRFIATAPTELDTPIGPMPLDVRKVLPPGSGDSQRTWTEALAASPAALSRTLFGIATVMPYTVTFILDQAEEILTIDQTANGDAAREMFFEFLATFTRTEVDLKLIVALRTEYYGRFISRLRRALGNTLTVREYFLDELTPAQMLSAIERPTVTDEIAGLGSPRSAYRFRYEAGLPERIVGDIGQTVIAGGVTPVLQIVCSTLWERVRTKPEVDGERVITNADYDAIGGAAEQVEVHLDRVLLNLAVKQIPELHLAFEEVDRWKEALALLVRSQADGSVTSDIVKLGDLERRCREVGCRLSPQSALSELAQPDVRVLRPVNVTDRQTRQNALCYSLVHDTLGLVLRRWNVVRSELLFRARASTRKERLIGGVGTIAMAVAILVLWRIGRLQAWYAFVCYYLAFGAVVVLLASLAEPRVRTLMSPTLVWILRSMWPLLTPRLAARMLADPQGSRDLQAYPELRQLLLARSKVRANILTRWLDAYYDSATPSRRTERHVSAASE